MPVIEDPSAHAWRVLMDDDGRLLARFLESRRDGRDWADLLELADGAALEATVPVVLRDLAGWRVFGPPELGLALIAEGARLQRHCHVMQRALSAPPPVEWGEDGFGDLRLAPVTASAAEIAPAMHAVYDASHVDFEPGDDELPNVVVRIERLLSGQEVGRLLPCSRIAVDPGGRVVGAALVCDLAVAAPPFGGPWLSELFRDPAAPGAGAALLRRALFQAAADGLRTVGLAVTDGNSARGLYEAHGFTHVLSSVGVDLR